jgi:hypothetical protein
VPTNKIGQLRTGQGLRRNAAQKEGGWVDGVAKSNFEMGDQIEPGRSKSDKPSPHNQWGRKKG